jgi:hypothetical protein
MDTTGDQAQLPVFRGLLGVVVAFGLVFGVGPYFFHRAFADLTGFPDDQVLIYRLAGAATLGYGVVAVAALVRRSSWGELRISMVAVLTFNAAAFIASLRTIQLGQGRWFAYLVLVASGAFSVIVGYWLRKDRRPAATGPPLSGGFRMVLRLATVAALVFGLLPLILPSTFATIGGLPTNDHFILRLAGAGALGYGVAGLYEVKAHSWGQVWLAVVGAAAFNLFSALAAASYVLQGGRAWIAFLILLAAAFFTITLGYAAFQHRAR